MICVRRKSIIIHHLNQLNGQCHFGEHVGKDKHCIIGSDNHVNQVEDGPDCFDRHILFQDNLLHKLRNINDVINNEDRNKKVLFCFTVFELTNFQKVNIYHFFVFFQKRKQSTESDQNMMSSIACVTKKVCKVWIILWCMNYLIWTIMCTMNSIFIIMCVHMNRGGNHIGIRIEFSI